VKGDLRDLPRVAPLKSKKSNEKNLGKPPRGGVKNLIYKQVSSQEGIMNYEHAGKSYYIKYSPAKEDNCYFFETKTVTNNGVVKKLELCR